MSTPGDTFPKANPADIAEQAIPVGEEEGGDAGALDPPLESDPADFQDQHLEVPAGDDDYR